MERFLAPFVGPVGTAAAAFPFVALLTLVPFALLHYRKHGRVHPWRALVIYSFFFYVLTAAFLVSLPLPDRPVPAEVPAWLDRHAGVKAPRLDPTGFLTDVLQAAPGTERTRALLQAVFNGFLLFPFGVYLVYAFRRKVLGALVGGFLLSLLFEVSQLTGLFGIYPGPYRLFDTGDLILNTAGSLAGGLTAAVLMRFRLLPDLDALPGPKTPWIGAFRRGLALGIDGAAALVTGLGAVLAAEALGLGQPWGALVFAGAGTFWMVLVPALAGGKGPGKALTLCAVRRADGRKAGGLRIAVRQSVLWGPPLVLAALSGGDGAPGGTGFLVLVFLVWGLLWTVNGFQAVFDKEHAGWVDKKLGTRVRNVWK